MFTQEKRRGGPGHQRCRPASDRIDLAQIAGAITFDQRCEINEMDSNRSHDPRPRGPGWNAHDRKKGKRNQSRTDRYQGGGGKWVEPHLNECVPAGMARRGKKDSEKNEIFHSDNLEPRSEERRVGKEW